MKPSTAPPLLSVENLVTRYFSSEGAVTAVDGVNFTVERGETLGIAGESGCGKSTVALSLMQLVRGGEVASGRVVLDGTSLLELSRPELDKVRWEKLSFVPQAAMDGLNPVYRVGDQIVEAFTAHRSVGKADARNRARELLVKVGIDASKYRSYPHELSGGQRQRVMIAMALALEPDLIIADEPTTALDTVTQARILKLFQKLQRELGVAVVFISHDLSVLAQTCDRVLILYAGQVVELGNCSDLLRRPRHPYTLALVKAYPELGRNKRKFAGLSGRPPDLAKPPAGCRFAERCPRRRDVCDESDPALVEVTPGHTVRCHFT